MEKAPLPPGELAQVVRDTFSRSGIEDIGPNTPAALFITIAKWDGLLNQIELRGLRMLVRQLCPMQIEGFNEG